MGKTRPNRASLHLPRSVGRAEAALGGRLTWALLNLAMAMGVGASMWAREVTPIRKRGPLVVTDLANIRPVSYVDDLEALYDGAWLDAVRPALESFAGEQQAGGRFDAVLMTIGVLLALQLRRRAGLRALVLQADLQHGFDLAWRDAVRVQLRAAGLRGRWWLAADASLGAESVRVRIGPLVAPALALLEFGVGQGRRAGVHLFGALIRGLLLDGVAITLLLISPRATD